MDLTLEHEREVMAQRMFEFGLERGVIRHRSSVERTFVDWARLSNANFQDVDSERHIAGGFTAPIVVSISNSAQSRVRFRLYRAALRRGW
jgi:hypothetical protein